MFRKALLVHSVALVASLVPSHTAHASRSDDEAKPTGMVTAAAVRYYVWYRYPGSRWCSEGPFFSYYEATRAQQDLNRSGAQTFISTRPS